MHEPLLSICIPTYNRAELLDYCLENVRQFERFGIPFEVVVSDNASTDQTSLVIEKHRQAMPCLRYWVRPETGSSGQNFCNAIRHARGELFVYLADDDSLILEPLAEHVRRMQREAGLTAIYCDWIAYDDAAERELHRYFHFTQPACFGPEDPIGLLNFTLQQVLLPEVAVYRRRAFLQAECIIARGGYLFLHLMYRLSRLGRIAFELQPFYREHAVLKPQFCRGRRGNQSIRLHYIGDEFRSHLETITLWAFQDAGVGAISEEHKTVVRALIDRYLESRLPLEIGRSMAENDWLLAVELRRRLVLWHGAGSPEEQQRDVNAIVLPAALQTVRSTYCGLGDVTGLLLRGFGTRQIHDFFRQTYPEVKLLEPDGVLPETPAGRPLVLFRDGRAAADFPVGPDADGYSLRLDQLMENYRVNTLTLDLSPL
jgi:glycosyltransferase involved in cell wall biosynthesis